MRLGAGRTKKRWNPTHNALDEEKRGGPNIQKPSNLSPPKSQYKMPRKMRS